ncbi:helix-turn-helix domain-containing protein [Moheibacter sediminis]|nr:helix-turn-helix domain-containing protein [Moheibacter sediminis]
MMNHTFLVICVFFLTTFNSFPAYSQHKNSNFPEGFDQLRNKYMRYEENDTAAFKYLQQFLNKSSKEKNFRQLSRGYIDAIYFSKTNKLEYADSAIAAANFSKQEDFIARAYLSKGSIYYFNYKQYQKALNEYLKAHKFAEKSDDDYLKNRIIYQLAVVKGYLGYYPEAIELLYGCIDFFESKYNNPESHPNIKFNHQKGYLNSIHQLAQFHFNNGDNAKVDSLVRIGLSHTPSTEAFSLEQSSFYKLKGMHYYSVKNYSKAIEYLKKSMPEIVRINDFAQLSIIHFYLGKSFINMGNEDEGIAHLYKIDSIFSKEKFLLPELRNTYEILISHHNKSNQIQEELYYTNQLLKANHYFLSDFKYLSQRISKDYDNYNLSQQNKVLYTKTNRFLLLLILCIIGIFLLILKVYLQRVKQKKIIDSYNKIITALKKETGFLKPNSIDIPKSKSNIQNSELLKEILQKLAFFESSEKYLDSELTQAKLAVHFKTNTSYLSQIINEYKDMNYNDYINTLRINYITKQLYIDKKYLNYSIEALAEKSGFSSRQVFSNVFFKINNLRPKDFIVNRKNELAKVKENVIQ